MGRPHDHPDAGRAGPRGSRGGVWFACLLVLITATCLVSAGCRPNKRYDLIEAELRTRDRELAETRAALDRAQTLNRAYEQGQARGPAEVPVGVAPGPSGGGAVCSIREISLGRGTGGVDEDDLPGDESLMVVIIPRDSDKSEVKVPARAQIAAWEITPQGIKNPIGSWDIPAERLRPTWRNGLVSTGYFVGIPWQTFPTTERVRVAVRLTTTDGQAFEADRDLSVRPVPQAVPRTGPQVQPFVPNGPNGPNGPVPNPGPPTGREPLLPMNPPPGVPPTLPPGVEELPPPKGTTTSRSAGLLPPIKQ